MPHRNFNGRGDLTTSLQSRVCTVVHYAVLEAIRAVYGIWQIWPLCK